MIRLKPCKSSQGEERYRTIKRKFHPLPEIILAMSAVDLCKRRAARGEDGMRETGLHLGVIATEFAFLYAIHRTWNMVSCALVGEFIGLCNIH